MRKYLKRKNKAVAFIAIALMICTLCALPVSAKDVWKKIGTNTEGYYEPLKEDVKYRIVIDYEGCAGTYKSFEILMHTDDDDVRSYSTIHEDKIGADNKLVIEGTKNELVTQIVEKIPNIYNADFLFEYPFKFNAYPTEERFALYEIAESEKSSNLITEMFSSFRAVIVGLTNGIKGMFNNILWIDGTAQSGLSHFAKFGFVMAGLSLALGLGYVIISKIGR